MASKPETAKVNKSSGSQDELDRLRAELRGMEVLLQQNAALEKEVERLNTELDEATLGVQKKGYLYKWREREIYYATKWGLRYFVLQGNKISYFLNDHDNRPRRTIDLSNCYVRDEGKKKGYHMFSIYLGETATDVSAENPMDSSLLLRMSSESSAEALLWIDMLEQACALNDGSFPPLNTPLDSFVINDTSPLSRSASETSPTRSSKRLTTESTTSSCSKDKEEGDWGHPLIVHSNDDLTALAEEAAASLPQPGSIPAHTMHRVRSSSKVLQKSLSRQTFTRRLLANRAPQSLSNGTTSPAPGNGPSKRTKGKGIHRSFPPFKPMHVQSQTSPLSPDSKVDHNFRGFFNLGVIILLISHLELIINNLMRYGFKATLPLLLWTSATLNIQWTDSSTDTLLYIAAALGSWVVAVLLSFAVESAAARYRINERLILGVHFFLGTMNILVPCCMVWYWDAAPGANMLYLLQSVIVWMKLISYAHANRGLRRSSRRIKQADKDDSSAASAGKPSGLGSRGSSVDEIYSDNNAKPQTDQMALMLAECKDLQPPFLLYPQNITFSNLSYFLVAPTLCYQLNYPRLPAIRWGKVGFIIFRLIFVAAILIFAVEQYITPTLESALAPMEQKDIFMIIERLLKLSIPNTYVWLLGFYLFFHLWLNLLAELTRFGDRQFYKEWWNARTIDEYWRTWNMPVHHWVTRHLYFPLIRMGWSKTIATLVVFAFSAVMHEVIISLPFRYIAGHAFIGMLAQAPLIMVTKYMDRRFDNAFIGNAVFWCSFCVFGQPMGIILYYYDLWKAAQGTPLVL